jgi:hypothetical protein
MFPRRDKQGVLTPERGPDRRPIGKLAEISDEEAAVVAGLAADANAIRKARRYDPARSIDHVGERSSRSAITARGNIALVVHLHDSAAVVVYVCQIPGLFPGLIGYVSVGGIRLREKIPLAVETTRHGRQENDQRFTYSKNELPWCLRCSLYLLDVVPLLGREPVPSVQLIVRANEASGRTASTGSEERIAVNPLVGRGRRGGRGGRTWNGTTRVAQ